MLLAIGVEAQHPRLAKDLRDLAAQLPLLDLKTPQHAIEAKDEIGPLTLGTLEIEPRAQGLDHLLAAPQSHNDAVINGRHERERVILGGVTDRAHEITALVMYEDRVLRKDARRQRIARTADQPRIFLRRRCAVDLEDHPVLGVGTGDDKLFLGGLEMIETEPLETERYLDDQQQRRILVEPPALQHERLIEIEAIPGRAAKDRNIGQHRLQRRNQKIFLLRQTVGEQQRQPVPPGGMLKLHLLPLRRRRDGGKGERAQLLYQHRGAAEISLWKGQQQQRVRPVSIRRDLPRRGTAENRQTAKPRLQRTADLVKAKPLGHKGKDETGLAQIEARRSLVHGAGRSGGA